MNVNTLYNHVKRGILFSCIFILLSMQGYANTLNESSKNAGIPKNPNADNAKSDKQQDPEEKENKKGKVRKYIALGRAGVTTVRFGNYMPTLFCAPLRLCVLSLEQGEVLNSIHVGDTERWMITPTLTGEEGSGVNQIIIKPTDPGISTSLVIATQKRTYLLTLVSDTQKYMPFLRFSYPSQEQKNVNRFIATQKNIRKKEKTLRGRASFDNESLRVEHIETNYRITGEASWKPTSVYHDGLHTFIKFPPQTVGTELPILLVMQKGTDTPLQVNYRVKENLMKVDYVVERAVLVAGVGDSQTKVTINLGGK